MQFVEHERSLRQRAGSPGKSSPVSVIVCQLVFHITFTVSVLLWQAWIAYTEERKRYTLPRRNGQYVVASQ